jgi:tetratricopeptide (TPR) repeat protein
VRPGLRVAGLTHRATRIAVRVGRNQVVIVLGICALLGTGAAQAQSSLPQLETIEVTEPLHESLVSLQELWLEWLTAYHGHDQERASDVLLDIVSTMRRLGMERLADLSLGAGASAVQAARASDFERAGWALDAAELLDPRRPETAFAASTIARLEGRRLAALMWHLRGFGRLVWFRWESRIVRHDLLLWGLVMVILTGALFIALQAATKGPALFRDLSDLLARRLPPAVANAVAVALLFFPLVLPSGFLLLLAFWSVLLWGYSSRSERIVVVVVWLAMGVTPVLVSQQRQRVEVLMSPPVRAIQSLAIGRLEGSMLTDLGGLRLLLPESVAVQHLLADVHLQLGQWEFARSLYLDIIDAEPDNAAAELNLGAFYFRVADYASAIQLFQRASSSEAVAAAAFFNLSQTYSASYMFEQSEQILGQARRANEDAVSQWLRRSQSAQVVTVKGGLARVPEIHQELLSIWHAEERMPSMLASLAAAWSARLVLVVLAAAYLLARFCHHRGFYRQRMEMGEEAEPDDSLRRVLIPGMAAALDGRGYRAVAELLLPVALLILPLVGTMGYRIPWGYEPGDFIVWAIAGVGMLLYVSRRVIRGLRAGEAT